MFFHERKSRERGRREGKMTDNSFFGGERREEGGNAGAAGAAGRTTGHSAET